MAPRRHVRPQAGNRTALTVSQGSGTAAPGDPGAGSLSLDAGLSLAARQPVSARAILVMAIGQGTGYPAGSQDPTAGYYVLRDVPAVPGSEITDSHVTSLPGGGAGVSFKFTTAGRREVQSLTATIARRGSLVSLLGETFDQHFAILLRYGPLPVQLTATG